MSRWFPESGRARAIEQRPPKLDLENYPHLPLSQVATTAAADYLALLEAC